jgi:hypothetical protein
MCAYAPKYAGRAFARARESRLKTSSRLIKPILFQLPSAGEIDEFGICASTKSRPPHCKNTQATATPSVIPYHCRLQLLKICNRPSFTSALELDPIVRGMRVFALMCCATGCRHSVRPAVLTVTNRDRECAQRCRYTDSGAIGENASVQFLDWHSRDNVPHIRQSLLTHFGNRPHLRWQSVRPDARPPLHDGSSVAVLPVLHTSCYLFPELARGRA